MCSDTRFHLFADLKDNVTYMCKRKPATKIEWCIPKEQVRTSRPSTDGKRTIYEDWVLVYTHELGFPSMDKVENLSVVDLPQLSPEDEFAVSDYFRLDPDRGLTEAFCYGTDRVFYHNSTHEVRPQDLTCLAQLIEKCTHHGGRWLDAKPLVGAARLRLLMQYWAKANNLDIQYHFSDIEPVVVQPNEYPPLRALLPLTEWYCDRCNVVVTPDTGYIHYYEVLEERYRSGGMHYITVLCQECGWKHDRECTRGIKHRRGELSLASTFGNNANAVQHAATAMLLDTLSVDAFQLAAYPQDALAMIDTRYNNILADRKRFVQYVETMRRFIIPYYEQARFYFSDPLIRYRYRGYGENVITTPWMLVDIINTCLGTKIKLDDIPSE